MAAPRHTAAIVLMRWARITGSRNTTCAHCAETQRPKAGFFGSMVGVSYAAKHKLPGQQGHDRDTAAEPSRAQPGDGRRSRHGTIQSD